MITNEWCAVENDPGIFSELLCKYGVQKLIAENCLTLDADFLSQYGKIYGLLLLEDFSVEPSRITALDQHYDSYPDSTICLVSQVIPNSGATVGLLNIVLNTTDDDLLGDGLKNYRDSISDFSPILRGEALDNLAFIREAHNYFRKKFVPATYSEQPPKSQEYSHYVSFIEKNGKIIELDGLKAYPTISKSDDENAEEAESDADCSFSQSIRFIKAVKRRISFLEQATRGGSDKPIPYALLAIVEDPLESLRRERGMLPENDERSSFLDARIEELNSLRKSQKLEIARKYHNYALMFLNLLTFLKDQGKLQPILEELMSKKAEACCE